MNNELLTRKSTTFPDALERLLYILQVLRSPQGCPWDRSQTIDSFCKNLLEESYEYIDAVQTDDIHGCHEEIGDVFLVITMLGMMHEEHDSISIAQMIDGTSDKLVRRHPHVFSSDKADNPEEVIELWDSIKENLEGKTPTDDNFFHHLPKALPPLDRAQKIQKRVKKVGFDWDTVQGSIDKLREELDELEEAVSEQDKKNIEEEIGDMLFSMVNIARHLKVTSSLALHRTNEKFIRRFNAMRDILTEQNISVNDAELAVMEEAWNQAKKEA